MLRKEDIEVVVLEKETKKKFRVVLTCDPELRDKIFCNGRVCDRFSNCGECVKLPFF